MRMWKRAGIASVLVAATVGIMSPAASAAPMPWETSLMHQPAPQIAPVSSAVETGTVSVLCGPPCYQ